MGFAGYYLRKQGDLPAALSDPPSGNLSYIVIIPAYCETDLIRTLECLWQCKHPSGHVEVIVVVNFPESAGDQVRQSSFGVAEEVRSFSLRHNEEGFRFRLIEAFNLPVKHAGAGLARKIGMDEALRRFDQICNQKGLIISLDADCLCDMNYFEAIETHNRKFPDATGFNLYFEHPVADIRYDPRIREGIVQYELHLRYVNQFLRYAGFPFAFHTVGSSFAVRAMTYAAQGGMNKRKAGEDFYFLHKIIPLGNFHEINTTRVIPSPRPSDRVPFGTGAAISRYVTSEVPILMTYHPDSFMVLKSFFDNTRGYYKQSRDKLEEMLDHVTEPLKGYLRNMGAAESIHEINCNCSHPESFHNRFFRWFDAFRVVKFLNHASQGPHPTMSVIQAAQQFLTHTGSVVPPEISAPELLTRFREIERLGRKWPTLPR